MIRVENAIGKKQCEDYPLNNFGDALHDIDVNGYKVLKIDFIDFDNVRIVIEIAD